MSRSRIQIAAGFSTTFVKPFARKTSRSMSYELTRNSRVSDDLAVLQSGTWLPIVLRLCVELLRRRSPATAGKLSGLWARTPFAAQTCSLQVRQGRTRCGELRVHFLNLFGLFFQLCR